MCITVWLDSAKDWKSFETEYKAPCLNKVLPTHLAILAIDSHTGRAQWIDNHWVIDQCEIGES